jgi:hypothetical protein
MRIVQLGDFGSDGDAVHRMVAPSKALGAMPGVEVVNCRVGAQAGRQLAADADVVVVQFHDDWDLLGLVQQRRDAGRVTVFEANDYFFDLQAWSPLRQAWSDRTVQELYVQLLRACDGVQTSSRWLAGQWRSRGAREVAVFDNHLGQVPPLPEVPVRPLTIG